jgi:hypothetical protein
MYKPGDVLGIKGEAKQWRVELVIGAAGEGGEPMVRYRMLGQDGVVAEWVSTAIGCFSRRNPDGTLEVIEVTELEVLSKG